MASRAARVLSVEVRDFRGYEGDRAELTDGLTVIAGPNGAGKTNLLEAVYFGCTGLSFRTSTDRDLVRFGASTTRVVVRTLADDGTHELAVGFSPGAPKRMSVDGSAVARLLDVPGRPLLSVFAPDRLELVKGVPAVRRSHLDRFVTALWPARTGRVARMSKPSVSATHFCSGSAPDAPTLTRCRRGMSSSRGTASR